MAVLAFVRVGPPILLRNGFTVANGHKGILLTHGSVLRAAYSSDPLLDLVRLRRYR